MMNFIQETRKLVKCSKVVTDNVVFWLHYRVAAILLVACSFLLTCNQVFGQPIHCGASSDRELYSQSMMDAYCWTRATYTLAGAHLKKDSMYAGVDPSVNSSSKIYHRYYQWVPLVLLVQALFFCAPHALWKSFERKRMENLVKHLHFEILNKEQREEGHIEALARHLANVIRGHNDAYALVFFACELLNLVNDLGQVYAVNVFLGGQFTDYGLRIFDLFDRTPEERDDPLVHVFPLMTKCFFKKVGVSGNVQSHDLLCLLPFNMANQKIYVVFWYGVFTLVPLSAAVVFYRFALMLAPRLRYLVLKTCHRSVESRMLNAVTRDLAIGDWFLLVLLGRNLASNHFVQLIVHLSDMCDSTNNNDRKTMTPATAIRGSQPGEAEQPLNLPQN